MGTLLTRTRSPEDAESVYRRMAKILGIRIVRGQHPCDRRHTYTGKTIQTWFTSHEQWLSDVAHELGHYFAADATRRHTPEWGLGESYEVALSSNAPRLVTDIDAANAEEALASMTGILLQRRVQGHAAARETWVDHGWGNTGDVEATLEALPRPKRRRAYREMRSTVALALADGGDS